MFNNKLDKKINNNNTNDDFIENIRDLLRILDYEPVLIKSGFDNNYLEYMSNGNDSLSFNECLELIKPYLYDLINVYKAKGEWKIQLSAEISFISQKPNSNEIRVMFTRSTPEEFMIGSETEEVSEKVFEDWIAIDVIIKHSIKICEYSYKHRKMEIINTLLNFIQTKSLFLENISNNC